MGSDGSQRAVRAWVVAVVLCGATGLVIAALTVTRTTQPSLDVGALVLFGALYLAAELRPIRLPHRPDAGEVTTSAAFAYALLLSAPLPLALAAIGVTTVVAEVRPGRRSALQRVFNVGQVLTMYTLGGAVLHVIGGQQLGSVPFSGTVVLALGVAGTVTFTSNLVLLSTVIALDQGLSVLRLLRDELLSAELLTHLLLVGMAPVFVLVWTVNPPLLPPLLFVVLATYHAMQEAVSGRHASRHDALTGLPNRRQLDDRLVELTAGGATAAPFVAMLLDLDGFKAVNDELGHDVGDELLVAVADRLREVDGLHLVARMGGDEFAALVERVAGDDASVRELGATVAAAFTTPFVVGEGHTLQVRSSVGVARWTPGDESAASLMRRADTAMYDAKRGDHVVALADADVDLR